MPYDSYIFRKKNEIVLVVVPCTRQLQQARLKRDESSTKHEGARKDETVIQAQHEEFPTVLTEFSSVVADTQQYMISSEDTGHDQVIV